MSDIIRNSAIEPVKTGGITHVDADSLKILLGWVESVASPEDLAWNSDRFKEVRDWLKTHKAAKKLRIEAVRIECISLRKVAQAGLLSKLKSHHERSSAEYFARLSDEEFDDLLSESEVITSPYSVMNARLKDEDAVDDWHSSRSDSCASTMTEAGEYVESSGYDRSLAESVQKILSTISLESDSFTVKEAADKLFEDLNDIREHFNDNGDPDNHDHFRAIPPEMAGEPLREVVRRVLRTPGAADHADVDGVSVTIPRFITFKPADGDYAVRVPWDRATIGQLMNMVIARERQAHELQVAAGNLRRLYEHLSDKSGDDSDRVTDLSQKVRLQKDISVGDAA